MIEVSQLTKNFGALRALDCVSFSVKQGDCFALLGPNGSGKTTALKCLAGLVLPNSGKLTVAGFDVGRGTRVRQFISYLPQRVVFPDHLQVREILDFYCRLRELPRERVKVVMRLLSCTEYADRSVSQLSGGMQQRLAVAVACLPDAPVLLLDEPTASLDPEGAVEFRALLASLKLSGRTILFSSHVLSDVENLADSVAILVAGRLLAVETMEGLRNGLLAYGRVRVVVANPDERFVKVALAAGAMEATFEGSTLCVAASSERSLAILHALESAGAEVERFSTEEPALEEIYLRYLHAEGVHRGVSGAGHRVSVAAAAPSGD